MVVVAEASVERCNLFVEVRSTVLMFENLGGDAIAFLHPENGLKNGLKVILLQACMNFLFLVAFQ